jgi:hypothetical protein
MALEAEIHLRCLEEAADKMPLMTHIGQAA